MTSVPVLSLKTGLVYGYTQDEDSAKSGNWVWYIVAIDWASGDEVWRVRTGAGGLWNDGYLPGAIGPDATFYQVSSSDVFECLDSESRMGRQKTGKEEVSCPTCANLFDRLS